jgi:hypothetical protein
VRIPRAALAAALIALLFTAAHANDKNNETAIYTADKPYIEAGVRIDNRLKVFPKLFESLVREGKKFGADNEEAAAEQWREDKTAFPGGMPYSYHLAYRLRAAAGKYVSVIIDESEYTGGAHPNHGSTTLLWDRDKHERVDFRTLFKDPAPDSADMQKLSKLILDALAAEKKKRDVPFDLDDMWFKDWKADFDNFGQPSLAPSTAAGKSSGVTFHFSPYEAGAYAEGDYVAFVPASALLPLLTPEAQKLFGGERPEGDKKE